MSEIPTERERQTLIVIVDDEPDMATAIRRAVGKKDGWRVEAFTDPEKALALISAGEVDVLLSDVEMPGMSGHELVAHARRSCPGAIRIMVTGVGTVSSAVRAINEGEVHRYVEKPFDYRALRQVVEEAVARKHELDLATEAGQRARRRVLLMQALESEHPGITELPRDRGGAYVLDRERATDLAERLGFAPFFA